MQSSPKGRRGVAQVFHRLASSTQTNAVAKMQVGSCELWGGPPNSPIPSAKAYRNALPTTKRGIEFTTPARPCPGNGTPYEARWYYPKIRAFDVTVSDMRSSISQFT